MTTCVALLETVESPRITNIQFGLLNPELVRKQSVVQVTKSTLYQRQLPHSGGLNDLRMGTSDRRLPCGTCKNDVLSCVGHPGHIELAAPVYHVSMINVVLKVLRCVCYWCSRLLVDVEEDVRAKDERLKTLDPKDRLNFMVNLCKTKHFCRHCNGPQPKYTQMRSATQIRTDFRDKDESTFETPQEAAYVKQPFTPAMARSILRFIPDDEVELLGINPAYARPEWMVLTVLQVPPPISRPSIMATDGSRARGQDDITIKLQDILKASLALQAAFDSAKLSSTDIVTPMPPAILTAWDVLQQHLSQFMHHDTGATPGAAASTSGGAPPRSNRPLRLIPARIKGKKGRFRGTLGGKRVDYSARTVVSPAPGYDIDEVGVPEMIARHLTFPERVTPLNIEELSKRVRNGPGALYGAVSVVMPDGSLVDLTLVEDRDSIELQVGWVVERYLKNGDWVLFNRQPSLHRMSIMAHRVRIIHDKTFRLPICDTTPYNADFDGDEMNLHVIRTLEGIAEARELMSVTTQLISPQSNKPIIGLVQDSLVAVYLLTQKDTFLTRAQISQMVMPIQYPLFTKLPPPSILKPVPLWTGKQLFSLLFPAFSLDIAVRSGAAASLDKHSDGFMDMAERRVVVKNGELLAGSLCKKTMGTSAGGIIHVLVKDCGNEVAARFIGDAQRVLVEFLLQHGFSVGVGDCIMPHETHMKVNGSINRSLVYGDQIRADAAEAPPALVEACMFKLMTGVLTRTGALVQEDLPLDNRVYTMVQSGAKGSSVNIAQILGCVGQQSVEGGRIAPDVNGRTLPCYLPHEQTAESRGFVANSYGTGLTAQEYFMHSMGGREGLVDTAVKTASTGYIQRRLVKAKEGLQVRYDNTVRNTKDQIVQFYYGGDSFDPVFVEKQSLRTFHLSNAALRTTTTFTADELRDALTPGPLDWEEWADELESEYHQLVTDRDQLREAKMKLQAPDGTVFVTVSPQRLLLRAQQKFHVKRTSKSDARSAFQVRRLLHAAFESIAALRRPTATFVTLAYIRSVLTLKTLVLQFRLPLDAIRWVAEETVLSYRRSLAPPGEMVGTLGAASIGEPCTQMTLNTFHTAGVAEKTVTLGVPRLKELIDTSRNIKTPSLTVYFEKPYCSSEKMARVFGVSLEHTLLQHVVLHSSVEYDPDPWNTTIPDDVEIVNAYRNLFYADGLCSQASETVIRYVLDREVLARKGLNVTHVAAAIQAYVGDSAQIMRSEVNMLTWCVRLRFVNLSSILKEVDDVLDEEERKTLEHAAITTTHDFLLDNVAIHGVPGIDRAVVHAQDVVTVGEDGALVKGSEWMADTNGANLRSVLMLPYIDKLRTISNDIHEVLDVLGIEAAQQVLLDEIRAVLSFDGSYVNERHLQLLVDVMTLSGTLTAMTRHSMHKLGGSTYHHASFEETQDVLIHAAAFGTYDKITGVTENLMMGMLMQGGTGACDVIVKKDAVVPPPAPVVVKALDLKTSTKVAPLHMDTSAVVKPLFPSASDDAVEEAEVVEEGRETAKKRRTLSVVPPLKPAPKLPTPKAPPKPVAQPGKLVQRTVVERQVRRFVPLSPQTMDGIRSFRPLSPLILE